MGIILHRFLQSSNPIHAIAFHSSVSALISSPTIAPVQKGFFYQFFHSEENLKNVEDVSLSFTENRFCIIRCKMRLQWVTRKIKTRRIVLHFQFGFSGSWSKKNGNTEQHHVVVDGKCFLDGQQNDHKPPRRRSTR